MTTRINNFKQLEILFEEELQGVIGGINVGNIRPVVWEAQNGNRYTGTPSCLRPVLEEGEFAPAVCYTGTVVL